MTNTLVNIMTNALLRPLQLITPMKKILHIVHNGQFHDLLCFYPDLDYILQIGNDVYDSLNIEAIQQYFGPIFVDRDIIMTSLMPWTRISSNKAVCLKNIYLLESMFTYLSKTLISRKMFHENIEIYQPNENIILDTTDIVQTFHTKAGQNDYGRQLTYGRQDFILDGKIGTIYQMINTYKQFTALENTYFISLDLPPIMRENDIDMLITYIQMLIEINPVRQFYITGKMPPVKDISFLERLKKKTGPPIDPTKTKIFCHYW